MSFLTLFLHNSAIVLMLGVAGWWIRDFLPKDKRTEIVCAAAFTLMALEYAITVGIVGAKDYLQ